MIIEDSRIVRRYKAGYVIKEEIWKSSPDDEGTIIRQAYTPEGDYIGSSKSAYRLCKVRGIKPEKSDPNHTVCSIGFCELEQKWYGWSHRAIYGFGIGSTCKPGDIHYRPSTPQELFDEITQVNEDGWQWQKPENVEIIENGVRVCVPMCQPVNVGQPLLEGVEPDKRTEWEEAEPHYFEVHCGRGEWTAETLEDAKQMAIDFAEGVS